MKLVQTTNLVARGAFSRSAAWQRVVSDVREAVLAVRWPPDGPDFTIYPEAGRSRGKGNGVRPIKGGFVTKLALLGWTPEGRYPRREADLAAGLPGAFDAHLDLSVFGLPPFVVEWETGNIASGHRALDKMALGLLNGLIIGGLLVLPTRRLNRYLTDRVGNYEAALRSWSRTSGCGRRSRFGTATWA